jgi:hypothetical protein
MGIAPRVMAKIMKAKLSPCMRSNIEGFGIAICAWFVWPATLLAREPPATSGGSQRHATISSTTLKNAPISSTLFERCSTQLYFFSHLEIWTDFS